MRGSEGHLVATLNCPGESGPFLVAVKVDGKAFQVQEVRCAGYGSQVYLDAGPWEAPDTLWHQVEIIADLLNLFKETDENNNRAIGQIRTIEPDLSVNQGLSRFIVGGTDVTRVTAGTPVTVVVAAQFRGRYRSVELSVKSGLALDVTRRVTAETCEAVIHGPTLAIWEWTPPGPGSYPVDFRVTPLSGEHDQNPSNNVLTRTLTVVSVAGAAR